MLVTPRVCLSEKSAREIEAEYEVYGVRCYRHHKKSGQSKQEFLKHDRLIISIEQVHLVGEWMDKYRDAIVIMDEFVTTASSLVNGITVRTPLRTMRTLRELVAQSAYFIAMDVRRLPLLSPLPAPQRTRHPTLCALRRPTLTTTPRARRCWRGCARKRRSCRCKR